MAAPHVFVDPSGRRRRRLRLLGVVGGAGLLCLLVLLGVSLVTDPAPESPQWSRRTDVGSNGESNDNRNPGSDNRRESGDGDGGKADDGPQRTGRARPGAPTEPPTPRTVPISSPSTPPPPSSSPTPTDRSAAENRLMPPVHNGQPDESGGAGGSR